MRHVLVPYDRQPGQSLPKEKETWNYHHSRCRMAIEHTFGLLKGRFASLKKIGRVVDRMAQEHAASPDNRHHPVNIGQSTAGSSLMPGVKWLLTGWPGAVNDQRIFDMSPVRLKAVSIHVLILRQIRTVIDRHFTPGIRFTAPGHPVNNPRIRFLSSQMAIMLRA
jgi:hypothetical protein